MFLFSPDSAIWHINRERVLLLGGARALLMQLAHPLVAEAVYHHSYVFRNPLKRLHRTLRLTLALVFGTVEQVNAAVAEIDRAHRPATGRLSEAIGAYPAGEVYNARNPWQGMWIQATLIEGAIHGYETFVRPLSHDEKEAFYQQSKTIGELMGIQRTMLPATLDGLYEYMQRQIDCREVIVSAKAREIAPFLTGQSIPLMKYAAYPSFRLTVGLLPPEMRAQYGYTFSAREARLLDTFCGVVRAAVPYLPPVLRFMPEYRRAQRLLML